MHRIRLVTVVFFPHKRTFICQSEYITLDDMKSANQKIVSFVFSLKIEIQNGTQ